MAVSYTHLDVYKRQGKLLLVEPNDLLRAFYMSLASLIYVTIILENCV